MAKTDKILCDTSTETKLELRPFRDEFFNLTDFVINLIAKECSHCTHSRICFKFYQPNRDVIASRYDDNQITKCFV